MPQLFFLDFGQYRSNAMSTGIRVQQKVSFLIRVAEDRCLRALLREANDFSSSSFQLKTCVCSVHSDTLEGLGQARTACNFSGSVATPNVSKGFHLALEQNTLLWGEFQLCFSQAE